MTIDNKTSSDSISYQVISTDDGDYRSDYLERENNIELDILLCYMIESFSNMTIKKDGSIRLGEKKIDYVK